MTNEEAIIKNKFVKFQEETTADTILYRLVPGFFVLALLMMSDLFIIDSKFSFFIRLPILILVLFVILIRLTLKNKSKLIFILYNIILTSAPIMLYAKILVHNDDKLIISAVIGAIVSLLLVFLELKVKLGYSLIIFVLPFIIFLIALFLFKGDYKNVHFIYINILPFIIIGFFANYLQNNLRYKLFKTNYLLEEEKDIVAELNEEISTTNEELKKLDATKNKFFSIIAHDLKSPFNVIIGYSNLLSEDYYDFNDEKRLKYIKEIESASNNTFELLDNLLTWARSQQGVIEIKKEKISLYIFISKIIEKHCGIAKTKAITISNNIPVELSLQIDKYTFRTIIINLLNNASKFTKAGGEIKISAEIINNFVEISISDTGVGMNEETINNLFNLEKNISTQGTNNEKGTGLGLILCKEFTERNNGIISVKSELNKGTIFTLRFPL